MTEPRDLGRLVSKLARSHCQALERSAEELEASERRFLDGLEKQKAAGRSSARGRRSWFGAHRRLAFAFGMAAGAAGLVGVRLGVAPLSGGIGGAQTRVEISPERAAPASPAHSASSTDPVARDPCAHPIRASGTEPLIDDFEDGDSLISPRDGRGGAWMMFKDNQPAGGLPLLTPVSRAPVTARNRRALHVASGELRDWGAAIQFDFQPSCYDASAYGGIGFSAKGPGRVYLAVREMGTVPQKWGGSCTEDCYDAHQKKIDLTAAWRSYAVPWSELRRRGYDAPPLDSKRIHDVAFMVAAADTPFDLWLDDVSFLVQETQ
jgi:hypothetical protein